jgi:hypothetical protein
MVFCLVRTVRKRSSPYPPEQPNHYHPRVGWFGVRSRVGRSGGKEQNGGGSVGSSVPRDAAVRRSRRDSSAVSRRWPNASNSSPAPLLLQAGVDLHVVQKVLRHRNPSLTVNTYGHLSPEYLHASIDKLQLHAPAAPASPARHRARAVSGGAQQQPFGASLVQTEECGAGEPAKVARAQMNSEPRNLAPSLRMGAEAAFESFLVYDGWNMARRQASPYPPSAALISGATMFIPGSSAL